MFTPTAADAALAATRPAEFLLSDDGTSREVYLINGVVYKVNRGAFLDNEDEFHNINAMREVFAANNAFLPCVAMFGDVLAMEHIEGELTGECFAGDAGLPCDCPTMCLPAPVVANLVSFGWRDPAYGNAIYCDGALYIIDLA